VDAIHRGLGEGLFVVYLLAMIVAFIYSRRADRIPPWLLGIAHGLLGLQVLLGLFLLITDGLAGVPWYHPVLGLITLAALGLTPLLRQRLLPGVDTAVLFALIAVLALATQFAARLG
jgi:heme A synthase